MPKLTKSTDYFDWVWWRLAICSAPWWDEIYFEGDQTNYKHVCGLFGIWGVYWRD